MGIIFDVKRFAIHDGPGIRTTVFFKGCPLRCLWCHNPEGKTERPEFLWEERKCLTCRDCEEACDANAITFSEGVLTLNPGKCNSCQACVNACQSQALKLIGVEMTVDQVMREIERDFLFFDESDGGVTFSGGEPLMQPQFLCDLLKSCREAGIQTAVDTCGYAEPDILLNISKQADLFLYDLKVIDNLKHKEFTGVSNKLILNNLKELSRSRQRLAIRFPVVPGVNDNEEDVSQLGAFLSTLGTVKEITLLPYHKGGVSKSKALLDHDESLFISHPPSNEKLTEIKSRLLDFGIKTQIGGR